MGVCTFAVCLQLEVLETAPSEIMELDVLEVVSVDLHKEENSSSHHTDSFQHSGLVVRRGQPFTISVTTNKSMPKGWCLAIKHWK